MEETLRNMEAISSLAKREIFEGIDTGLRSLALLERSRRVRRIVDLAIRGIKIESIPSCLDEAQGAILVSNYPSVSQSLRAVIKVGCRLSQERPRLRAIARPEIITEANSLMKVLGVHKFVFPVQKDQDGVYRLETKVIKEVLAYVDVPGNVLWLSITGRTRGNGLLEGDLRTGAALLSLKKGVPLLPMGLVTRRRKGKPRVAKVRFGELIPAPEAGEMDDFGKADLLIDLSKLAMCRVAELLPPGQRGDFENAEEKLEEVERRLSVNRP
jgi:hypothetical protein